MADSSTETPIPKPNADNFVFAFNDFDFSDRLLRLEISPDDDATDSGKKYHEWFSSIQATRSKDSESCNATKVKTLHITSAILAAKSPFFYKLFKNGMKESQKKSDVSFKINASEEATLMDLLNFMYGNTMSATTIPGLVDVLIAADKFEVVSCMSYCVEMLLKFPMTLESALFYLELPSSVLVSEIVKPLIDAAKQYVAALYKDFNTKSQEEAMDLPLSAIEVVLGSDGLQVNSEDEVFDFILKWVRASSPKLEERREILSKQLARLICFPKMSSSKLKEVLACPEFEHELVSKLVMEALFSKVELPCGQHIHPSKDLSTTDSAFSRRAYSPRCVVYFDLKKHELKGLFTSKFLSSQPFCVGGKKLYLSAQCCEQEQGQFGFGLFVYRAQGTTVCTIDFEFALMDKSSKEFKSKHKANNLSIGDSGLGSRNLLGIPWTEFTRDDSEYFINDVVHIRAELTLKSINNTKA